MSAVRFLSILLIYNVMVSGFDEELDLEMISGRGKKTIRCTSLLLYFWVDNLNIDINLDLVFTKKNMS